MRSPAHLVDELVHAVDAHHKADEIGGHEKENVHRSKRGAGVTVLPGVLPWPHLRNEGKTSETEAKRGSIPVCETCLALDSLGSLSVHFCPYRGAAGDPLGQDLRPGEEAGEPGPHQEARVEIVPEGYIGKDHPDV